MKKTFAFVLLVLFVSLVGCNQVDNATDYSKSTIEAKTTVQSAFETSKTVTPTTITPTTTPVKREYTAEELSEKTVPEIIDIMGGEFSFEQTRDLIWYSGGGFYIHNEDVLPGFVFYIDEAQIDYQKLEASEGEEKANAQIRENLKSGKYNTISFIAMYDSAKLNDSISADMNYQQFIATYGYAPTGAIPPNERVGHILRYDKERIKTVQVYYNYFGTRENSMEKEDDNEMNRVNPNIYAIVALPQELAIPEYKAVKSRDYEKYLGTWGNTGEVGRGYTVLISSVEGSQIECMMSLVSGSGGHMAGTSTINATIENDIAYFDFIDSWDNKGSGTLTFNDNTVILKAEITERGSMGYGFMTVDQVELTKISDSTANPFL